VLIVRKTRTEMPVVLTIGHSTRTWKDFLEVLRAQTSEFEAGLHRLMKLATQKRSTIMCAEAIPWRCRRSLIAYALTVRGIWVDDIMSMKRSQVHSIIPFARVQGHRVTYPVGDRSGRRVKRRSEVEASGK
jgi:hypothetical protein